MSHSRISELAERNRSDEDRQRLAELEKEMETAQGVRLREIWKEWDRVNAKSFFAEVDKHIIGSLSATRAERSEARAARSAAQDAVALNRLNTTYDDPKNPFALLAQAETAKALEAGLKFIGDEKPEAITFKAGSYAPVDEGAKGLQRAINEVSNQSRMSAGALIEELFQRASQKFGYTRAPERAGSPKSFIVLESKPGLRQDLVESAHEVASTFGEKSEAEKRTFGLAPLVGLISRRGGGIATVREMCEIVAFMSGMPPLKKDFGLADFTWSNAFQEATPICREELRNKHPILRQLADDYSRLAEETGPKRLSEAEEATIVAVWIMKQKESLPPKFRNGFPVEKLENPTRSPNLKQNGPSIDGLPGPR